jgi:hypothetical protein
MLACDLEVSQDCIVLLSSSGDVGLRSLLLDLGAEGKIGGCWVEGSQVALPDHETMLYWMAAIFSLLPSLSCSTQKDSTLLGERVGLSDCLGRLYVSSMWQICHLRQALPREIDLAWIE